MSRWIEGAARRTGRPAQRVFRSPIPSGVWTRQRAAASESWERFQTITRFAAGGGWGQKYLDQGIDIAEVTLGRGRVFLFGNELLFRSQPHGTFKLFFNAFCNC